MAQTDFTRVDPNTTDTTTLVRVTDDRREALRTRELGLTPPSDPVDGQWWVEGDETSPLLKLHQRVSAGWTLVFVIDVANRRIRKMLDADQDTYAAPTGTDGEVGIWVEGSLAYVLGANGLRYGSGASLLAWDMSARTTGMRLPAGTTAQRPAPAAGLMRYNTTTARVEQTVLVNGAWEWGNVPVTSEIEIVTQGTQQTQGSDGFWSFTGIPTRVRAIHIVVDGMNPGVTGFLGAQLGDSGGYETTGYIHGDNVMGSELGATNPSNLLLVDYENPNPPQDGFFLCRGEWYGDGVGIFTLLRVSGNTWVLVAGTSERFYNFLPAARGTGYSYAHSFNTSARKTLSGPLDRLRVGARLRGYDRNIGPGDPRLQWGGVTNSTGTANIIYA